MGSDNGRINPHGRMDLIKLNKSNKLTIRIKILYAAAHNFANWGSSRVGRFLV